MTRPRLLACTLGGALLGLLAPTGAAEATSCSDGGCDYDDTYLYTPADQDVDVPTNGRIWRSGWIGEATLLGPDGPVELVRTVLDDIIVLTPAVELAPMTAYMLLEDGFEESSFTTGVGPDTTPPALPVVLSRTTDSEKIGSGPCGSTLHFAEFEVDPVTPDAIFVVLDRAGTATLDPATLAGSVADLEAGPALTFRLGSGPCLYSWPEARRGAETTVRFGAFDRAGNFSGWTEFEEVRIGGCNVAGGANSPLALALLALASLRRRRRRPPLTPTRPAAPPSGPRR